jgi:hypothetical protein
MSELRRPPQPERPTPATLLIDERYEYRGYHSDGGVTRVRLYDRQAAAPVMLLSELPENTNTSLTNMLEYLVAEIGTLLMPHRFDEDEPFTVVEHYPAQPERQGQELAQERYARVTFDDWKLRRQWLGGVERKRVGQPSWQHLSAEDLVALLGSRPET